MNRLASWLPPLAWMAVIAWFSTATWSAENTGGILVTIARTFRPGLTPRDLVALHYFVRKLAHLTVYGILAGLWWRALVRERWATPSAAHWIALAVSLVWASLDEIHQVFEPSRTGSMVDVAIDGVGIAFALALIRHGAGAALGLGGVLLWTAALGGVAVLVVDYLAGVSSGLVWVTTPAAGALLGLLRLRRTRAE